MPTQPATAPRVLLADDDEASRRFLRDALHALGATTRECADGLQAVQLAREQPFDLLLLDCRMPGAGAREVLAALHAEGGASAGCLAVASSAEVSPATRQELLACGFHEVLRKPCGLAELRHLLALLPGAVPVLDDASALRVSGDAVTLQALRELLRGELDRLHDDLSRHGLDTTMLGDRLHRLRSSCGFCGASVLAAEAERLQRRLREAPASTQPAIERFRIALQNTLQALQ